MNSVMPCGMSPSTALNRTGFCEVAHPVVVTKNVCNSPTLNVTGSLGEIEQSDVFGFAASGLAGTNSTAATAADRTTLRNLGPLISCPTRVMLYDRSERRDCDGMSPVRGFQGASDLTVG